MNEITVEKRDLMKRKSKWLLEKGIVPAVIYNGKGESTNIQVGQGDVERLLQTASTSTILDIKFGDQTLKGIIKEIDTDPVKGHLRHIAFFEIDPSHESIFDIPIELTGVSKAVKNSLGVLVQPTMSLTVRCKLADVIDSIKVDISGLDKPGDTITLSDIELPAGMTLPNEDQADSALARISELQKIEVIVEETEEDEDAEGVEGEEGEEGEETEGEAEEGSSEE